MKTFFYCVLFIVLKITISAQNNEQNKKLFLSQSLEEIRINAKVEKKNYYIELTADWCYPCKIMEETTFKNSKVIDYSLENYLAIKLEDIDFDAIDLQLKYNIKSFPAILFFDYNGILLDVSIGSKSSVSFLKTLKEIHQKSTQYSLF